MVKYHISLENIDINSLCNEKTPLYIATENLNVEIVEILLTCPNVDVNFIFKENIKVNEDDSSVCLRNDTRKEWPLLFIAVEKNIEKVIKLLLSNANINVNCKYVCDIDFYECEKSKYTTRNTTTHEEKPVLYAAVENKRIDIAHLFLSKNNIDVNQKYKYTSQESNKYEYSKYSSNKNIVKPLLYLATEISNASLIKVLLLNKNIDVNSDFIDYYSSSSNCYTSKKYTALQNAFSSRNLEIIALFIKSNKVGSRDISEFGGNSISFSYDDIIRKLF